MGLARRILIFRERRNLGDYSSHFEDDGKEGGVEAGKELIQSCR